MFSDVLQHPNFSKYDLSSLKFGVMGGSPCPPELVKNAKEKLGMTNFAVYMYCTMWILDINHIIIKITEKLMCDHPVILPPFAVWLRINRTESSNFHWIHWRHC